MPRTVADLGGDIAEWCIWIIIVSFCCFALIPIAILSAGLITIVCMWILAAYVGSKICMGMIRELCLAIRHNIWNPNLWPPSHELERRRSKVVVTADPTSRRTSHRTIAKPKSRRSSHNRMDSATSTGSNHVSRSSTISQADTVASFASNEDRDFGDTGGWAGPNEESEAVWMARNTTAFRNSDLTESPGSRTPTRSRQVSLDVSPSMSRSSSRAPITSEYGAFQDSMRPRTMSNNQQTPSKPLQTPYGPQTPSQEGTFKFGADGTTAFSAGGSTTPTIHQSRSTIPLADQEPRSRAPSFHRRSANMSTSSLSSVPEGRTVGNDSNLDEEGIQHSKLHTTGRTDRLGIALHMLIRVRIYSSVYYKITWFPTSSSGLVNSYSLLTRPPSDDLQRIVPLAST